MLTYLICSLALNVYLWFRVRLEKRKSVTMAEITKAHEEFRKTVEEGKAMLLLEAIQNERKQ
jgi:hypothetical protein